MRRCLSITSVLVLVIGLSVAIGGAPAAAAAPDNDGFATPGQISGASGTVVTTNWFATAETGEPANHPLWAAPDDLWGHSIWYTWQAPTGVGPTFFELEVTDEDANDGYYPAFGVYTGDTLSSLTEIAYNVSSPKYGAYDMYARVDFTPVEGTTYRIGVGSKYEADLATLRWGTPGAAPGNDAFAAAFALADDTGSTIEATFESGEPTGSLTSVPEGSLSDLGGRSVWYAYTPTTSSTVALSLVGSDYDTTLGVYAGSSLGALSLVTFNDDAVSGTSKVEFAATAGVTYLVGIGGWGGYFVDNGQVVVRGGSGNYVLDVTVGIPAVLTHPSSDAVISGDPVSFSASASGDPAPTVQWERSTDSGGSWLPISGATDTTYSVASVDPSMNGYRYRAVFTNSGGSATTDVATLTVRWAPSVTVQPAPQAVTSGSPVSFSAAASGNLAPTVQWERSTDGGGSWSSISGATDTTYGVTSVDMSMDGHQYRAVFTNDLGSTVTEIATLTVTPGPATVTGLSATSSKGKITVTFAGAGDPVPGMFQCKLETRRGTWVPCSSGDVIKGSAKSVSVMASNTGGATWGQASTVRVTRAPK